MNKIPFVSVVIISKDRHKLLVKAINSIKRTDYPKDKYEIIVVEEGDNPREIPDVKYIFLPRKNYGYGYARNTGIKNANGEIIVFVDDDCIVSLTWLKELVSTFKNDIYGVTGGVLTKGKSISGKAENSLGFPNGGKKRIFKSKGKIIKTSHLSTCNCAYKREVFEDIGLFNENLKLGGEDLEFSQRVNKKYKCVFNPSAILYHKPRSNIYKVFLWFLRRGRAEYLLYKSSNKVERTQLLKWWLKSSVILKLIFCIVIYFAILKSFFNFYVFWVLLGVIYWTYITWQHRFLIYEKDFLTALMCPLVKFVMDSGMDLGRIIQPINMSKNK
ncbi:MAG: glycosyltransferase [Candidatus Aminicenantia bacterium]